MIHRGDTESAEKSARPALTEDIDQKNRRTWRSLQKAILAVFSMTYASPAVSPEFSGLGEGESSSDILHAGLDAQRKAEPERGPLAGGAAQANGTAQEGGEFFGDR
jgi:hypothetical protein